VSLVFVVCAIPAGNLGTHFGRRRTIMLGLLLMATLIAAIGFSPVPLLKTSLFALPGLGTISLLALLMMGVGLAWALVIIHPLPMLSNMVDNSRVGTYTGLYYAFMSFAAIVGPILNGWVVESNGKNYNSVMLFAPFAFALAWALMWGVKEPRNLEKNPDETLQSIANQPL
jgi:MFS family permease